jgi:hypothetical protein
MPKFKPTHAMSNTDVYNIWKIIKQRTGNPNHPKYKYYGERGITMCEEWKKSFKLFYEHIGPRPSPKHSIDRINVDGNYEPGNVRWADYITQNLNRRMNKIDGWKPMDIEPF